MKRLAPAVAIALWIAATIAGPRAADKAPVIFISIDTLRADHLSAYGYAKIRTPNIDAFAGHGTIFERMESAVPLTLPSHAVMMTSTHPFESQVQHNEDALAPGTLTLASVLKSQGYRTGAFVGSMILRKGAGLDQGFDVYDVPAASSDTPGTYFTGLRRDAAAVTASARGWIDKNRAAPFFAFVHLYDVHAPYMPPVATGTEPSIDGYDLEVAYVDRVLGEFRKTLVATGVWDRALVVLTADHGESLGDHSEAGHGYFIYDSTMHVPFIVHWPNSSSGARPGRSADPAGLIDVAPTILEALQLPVPPAFRGVSLLVKHERVIYGESPYAIGTGGAPMRSLVSGALKLINAPTLELYDLVADPRERTNLSSMKATEARALKTRLDALTAPFDRAPKRTQPSVSDDTRDRLRALGYTGGGPGAPGSRSANEIRRRLQIAESMESASMLMAARQYGRAVILLDQVLTWDRGNADARKTKADACRFVPTLPPCKIR